MLTTPWTVWIVSACMAACATREATHDNWGWVLIFAVVSFFNAMTAVQYWREDREAA